MQSKSRYRFRTTLAALMFGAAAASAWSATITVAPGEVAVTPGNSLCSLREAIQNAESDSDTSGGDCAAGSGADTIELANGSTYTLLNAVATVAGNMTVAVPEVRSVLTINGNGAIIERSTTLFSTTACTGAGAKFRLLMVGDIGNLTINNATLRYGCMQSGPGGAIHNHGTLVLDGVRVVNNEAFSAGGIQNDKSLTLRRGTVANNLTTNGAGGGIVNTKTLQVVESTIDSNTTPGAGGGVLSVSGAISFALTNSTLSSNDSVGLGGGALISGGSTTVKQATIASNHAGRSTDLDTRGGGVYLASGSATITGSLLVKQVNSRNCTGSVSATSSAADDATCTGATAVSSATVGPLADNGGPTRTHALLFGSPLIDAGNNASASGLTTDQRGLARIFNSAVDFGAFEYSGNTDVDGVSDTSENAVPNPGGAGSGDGNGDSIPDYQQNNVTSVPAFVGGGYGTVVSVSGKSLSTVSVSARPAAIPPTYTAPYGAFAFTALGVTVGATEAFELYVPYNPAIVGALKQNRITNLWEDVATSVTHIGTVKTKITYSLTDGGPYDADGLANGQIQDPVVPFALAPSTAGIPTLSEWGMIILSALLLLAGWGFMRRRGGMPRF